MQTLMFKFGCARYRFFRWVVGTDFGDSLEAKRIADGMADSMSLLKYAELTRTPLPDVPNSTAFKPEPILMNPRILNVHGNVPPNETYLKATIATLQENIKMHQEKIDTLQRFLKPPFSSK